MKENNTDFKNTRFGFLPIDWDCLPLGELVNDVAYGSSAKSSSDGSTPVLRMGNMQDGFIDWTNLVYTSDELEIKKYKLEKNTVLFNRTNTVDLVGKAAIYKGERPAIYAGYLIKINNKPELLNAEYLNYILNTYQIKSYNKLVLSVAVSQANINGQKLKTYPIPVPPNIEEQKAIANALSDVDALLTELEKLIAKKQAIKIATMQQLLTGKTRLPQFATYTEGEKQGQPKGTKPSELGEIPEDWDVLKIGTLFNITAGGDLKKNQFSPIRTDKHPYPIYSNAITNKGLYGYCSTFDYSGEYLTITARGGIGHATERDESFCAIGRLLVLSPKQNTNCKYVAEFANQYIEFANESTGVPQLTAPQVAKYNVAMPDFEEQITITNILSDMDNEIQTLEQHLAKTRQIKQGMMQELLTGRTRLPF